MKLHDFQRKAVSRIVKALSKEDRTKAIMPCGTGKTIVGINVFKKLKPKRTIVFAPSVGLVDQLLNNYIEHAGIGNALVVCHDQKSVDEAREKFDIQDATTDPQVIARELRKRGGVTIFSTYHSAHKIEKAMAMKTPAFDLAIFDEAHNTAGVNKTFSIPLDESKVRIRKRLFMTATPRIASSKIGKEGDLVVSMDNESQFGSESFYMSFSEAIAGGHLTDYRIAVFVVKESEAKKLAPDGDENIKELAKRIAIVRAMVKYGIRKMFVYHSSVPKMEEFSERGMPSVYERLSKFGEIDGYLWSEAIKAQHDMKHRRSVLSEFASLNGDSRAILNSVATMREGIDTPVNESVCMFDPKNQPIDIAQIVGRAIRKSANKKAATVVLPVFMPESAGDDVEAFIASSEFATVWSVLAAMKTHDDRVQGWIDSASKRKGDNKEVIPGENLDINIDMPLSFKKRFSDAIEAKMITRFREPMRLTEELVWQWMQDYYKEHGRWPQGCSKEIAPDGFQWGSVNKSLTRKERGILESTSLRAIREKMTGIRSVKLTEELVWQWMQDYYKEHGRWPSSQTAELAPDGTAWRSVYSSLRNCRRGIKNSTTMLEIIQKKTGLGTVGLTEDLIWKWMQEHYREHGKWPGNQSTEPTPDGSKWHAIDVALRTGCRGLPGGSSLIKLRYRMTGVCNRILTEGAVWKWMRSHYQQHKRWPTAGPEPTPFGISCSGLNEAMKNGYRGFPHKLSIAKFREKMLAKESKKQKESA